MSAKGTWEKDIWSIPHYELIYKWRRPGQKALGSTMLQVTQLINQSQSQLSLSSPPQANSLPILCATSH